MPITAAHWYDRNPDLRNLYQGDVVDGVPLVFTPAAQFRWVLLRPLPQGPLQDARGGLPRKFVANVDGALPSAWNRADGELVMGTAAVWRVMILSRSCNLDWKRHIQVAPVYHADDLEPPALDSLRENDNAYSFYLPPDGDALPESYADLSQTATVHISYLRRTDFLVRRLTGTATIALQEVLSEYYARPFGFNVEDRVPQATSYRCVNCFFTGGDAVPVIDMAAGVNFPECATCGTQALWAKVVRPQVWPPGSTFATICKTRALRALPACSRASRRGHKAERIAGWSQPAVESLRISNCPTTRRKVFPEVSGRDVRIASEVDGIALAIDGGGTQARFQAARSGSTCIRHAFSSHSGM